MQYPVLQTPLLGGGLLIALIAVVHVYVAQFAVGGGLYLVLTEHLARRRNSPALLEHVRRHTLFFLLLTMVFGSLTGVAIWFTIAVLSPGATLTLIHNFAFGWATEWVFFVGEIVTLLAYYYTFRKMEPRTHLAVGWLYFAFGWLSLFVITGIIGVMLTPGEWLETGDFWDGFFNPSFWPQVLFRTLVAFGVAGLFGFLSAVREKDPEARETAARFCALWTVVPLLLLVPAGYWYLDALPAAQRAMVAGGNPEIAPYAEAALGLLPALLAGGLLMALRLPRPVRAALAGALLLLGLVHFGSFEFIRESARRPYVIYGHTYSNGVTVAQARALGGGSYLASAKWAAHKSVTPENRRDAGRELFMQQCLSCHSVGGPMNDILPLVQRVRTIGMDAYLDGQGKVFGYMPPFLGVPEERMALAEHIVADLAGKAPDTPQEVEIVPLEHQVPPFDSAADEYALLAWCTLGMKCITDADGFFSFLPPGSAMGALLVRRGPAPEIVSEGVEIAYAAPEDMRNPAAHVDYWRHASSLAGKALPENVSAAGKGLTGTLDWSAKSGQFAAAGIPVVPYSDLGTVNPYPLFDVTATDKATGRVLARTSAVLPVGAEMGCKTCHGGEWRKNGVSGIGKTAAAGILAAHDKRNRTDLAARAAAGEPALCQSCHPDPLLGAEGRKDLLNLPAAMHGLHANYLSNRGDEVCSSCHPDSPAGATRCLRDVHGNAGLTCSSCHGTLEDHAISLLKKEKAAGKAGADRLLANLKPRMASFEEIEPRTPWVQEPDCLTCHQGFGPPQSDVAFNTWVADASGLYRNRKEDLGKAPCIACHNSPHAIYPTVNPYGADRDNVQPLQYQGLAGPIGKGGNCRVCHGEGFDLAPSDSPHHPMGLR
ncbi:MAG: cytochrome ubiquinol oxidase subunit I [Thermodesulfobacteriota bacterium]